jgi:hypothetical protein
MMKAFLSAALVALLPLLLPAVSAVAADQSPSTADPAPPAALCMSIMDFCNGSCGANTQCRLDCTNDYLKCNRTHTDGAGKVTTPGGVAPSKSN